MKFAVTAAGWLLLPFLVTTEPVLRRWNVGATVHTTSGPITGHAAKNRTQVSEYLGIPYAQPPLGQLRFAAPQQFTSTKPFDAAAFVSHSPHLHQFESGRLIVLSVSLRKSPTYQVEGGAA